MRRRRLRSCFASVPCIGYNQPTGLHFPRLSPVEECRVKSMAKPLDTITVVEFASHLGSAYAAMLLAEYGATTIRIEPRGGDPARGTPHFHILNRSKQALFLDLDSPS